MTYIPVCNKLLGTMPETTCFYVCNILVRELFFEKYNRKLSTINFLSHSALIVHLYKFFKFIYGSFVCYIVT